MNVYGVLDQTHDPVPVNVIDHCPAQDGKGSNVNKVKQHTAVNAFT